MMCGAYTLALAGHVRADFVYIYLKPRIQATLDLALLLPVLHPGHHRAHLRGVWLCRRLLAHRGAFECHGGGSAHIPLQDGDPDRRCAGDAPGAGRDRPLHRVSAHRRLAGAAGGRRGDRRDRYSALAQRVRGRGVAPRRDGDGARDRRSRAPPQRHGRRAWSTSGRSKRTSRKSHERSGTRLDDAGAHRGRDHDGFPDRLHAHGPRDDLRLHRFLGSSPSLVAKQSFRSDRAADLRGHDQRHAVVGAAVRLHGLRHGARGAGRPHVSQRAASVPPRARFARRYDAPGVRILGNRLRHRRRRRGA